MRDLRAVPVHVATSLLWSLQAGMDVRPNFELAETDLIGGESNASHGTSAGRGAAV